MRHTLLWASLLSVLLSLALGLVAIALAQGSFGVALDAYAAMFWGGLGDVPRFLGGAPLGVLLRPWGEAATKAGILMLTGLSVAVAFRVGLFNIGAQGQMLWGALAAAWLGAHLPLPSFLHPLSCLLAAALAGAAWGFLPAVLKLKRGVHEVISTIMLNWVAQSLIENWLVPGPLAAQAEGTHSLSGTKEILPTAQLARVFDDVSRLHVGFFLSVGLSFLVWYWLSRTPHGFETRAVGLGLETARASGIAVEARMYEAMGLSGALAGLAGALLVLGTEYKFPATLGAPYGFDGIAMALIGQTHPLGVGASALWFGALRAGGTRMQLFGVHKSFPELIQGLTLLLVAGKMIWEKLLQPRNTHGGDAP